MQEKNPNVPPKKAKSLRDYARYSNLGFQMVVIMLVGVFGGIKLDNWLETGFPVFTIVLSFLSVVIAIYIGIKDFIGTNKD
jgi:ATP synthase protein I